jgi:imidazole glycerol-phosphate synthase subunit HisF
MLQTKRIIPVLLIHKGLLYKSVRFKDHRYVGDPINAVRIFNEKEVDELVIIDIDASRTGTAPNLDYISEMASEAFMPLAYGGGITHTDQVRAIIDRGVEKVILHHAANKSLKLVSDAATIVGSSSTVVCIDVKKNLFGQYNCYSLNGAQSLGKDPVTYAKEIEQAGAGELVVNSIDRDGMMAGYDNSLIKKISEAVGIPVVALGGAGTQFHLQEVLQHGAAAAAAGSMFVFHGKHKAVLITYPSPAEIEQIIYGK